MTWVPELQEFIEATKIDRITMDQWEQFLEFSIKVDPHSLGDYDDTSAWPLLFDDLVDWYRSAKSDKK